MVAFALLALAGPIVRTRPGWWTIKAAYPRFSAGGSAARGVNAAARSREREAVRSFEAQAKREIPTLRKTGVAHPYELTITPHRIADRPGLASGYVERYDYLAGAHGTTRYEALDFGPKGRLRLQDLFRAGVDGRAEASRALMAVMKAMKSPPSAVTSGEWKGLTSAQADRFVVGKLGVLFLFDQYDVGVGAEGAPKVLVPWSKLPGIDQGVLAPLGL